jgi:hypothetical protein
VRRLLYRLGVAAGVIFCLGGVAFGYVAYLGSQLDRESKAYVDEAVVDIVQHWDKDAFVRRASPQLLQAIKPEELDSFFQFYSSLGTLVDYQGSNGSSTIAALVRGRGTVAVRYVARAKFQEGDADIQVTAVKVGGDWKLQGFRVDSPVLVTKAVGRKT